MKTRRCAFVVGMAVAAICMGGVAVGIARGSGEAASSKRVFVLPIDGPIDKGMLFVFRRAFREVRATKPAGIVVELDTPGGGLKETEEIISWIRSVNVPVYAYVNPRALSAGAIISFGTDGIFMAPGSMIGSAMPVAISPLGGGIQPLPEDVKEKMLSAVRAMIRGLAQENGHCEEVAEAMVDSAKEVKIGDRVVCAKGELLNLTAKEAIEIIPPWEKPVLARAIVDDLPALLDAVGLQGAEVVRFEVQRAERLARWITLIGPLLLSLGVLGLYLEFRTPGFGVPGIAGIVLLMIYFFGHYVAGLASIEDIALVVIGIVLIGIEVFVIPGFGFVGIAGILCVVAGFVLGLVHRLPDAPPLPGLTPPTFASALEAQLPQILLTIVFIAGSAWALSLVLPKTSVFRRFVLQTALTRSAGYVASNRSEYSDLLGQKGVAGTVLRPAGIGLFGDKRLDVVSTGDMIAKAVKIKIVQVGGNRIVVEEVRETDAEAGATPA